MPESLNKKTRSPNRVSRHKICTAIQRKIFQGEYAPGTRLGQIQLSKEFAVSQSVVRESLLELRAMGLVEMKDQLGAFVSALDSRKIQQAYEIREMLEGLAARLCCDRISREELRDLEQIVERMRSLSASESDELAHLDREFHKKLMHITRSDMLIKISESYEILNKFSRARHHRESPPDDHYLLFEPIRDNQPDEAERRMRAHIRRGWHTVEKAMADGIPLQWVE